MNWYDRIVSDEDNYDQLINAVEYYETELVQALEDVKIKGRLEKNSAELPGITMYRYNQLQDLEAILKFLNLKYDKIKYKEFKKNMSGNRQMSTRDAEKLAEGSVELYDVALLINQVSLTRNKFLGVTKGLECKNWQISSLVKLKTAGFEDHELNY